MKTPVIVVHIHCMVSRTDIVEYFFDNHPMVLTDMLMLKRLGFTKQNSSIMDKPHSLNVVAKQNTSRTWIKKGWGTKTLAAMMGAHPIPSARETI